MLPSVQYELALKLALNLVLFVWNWLLGHLCKQRQRRYLFVYSPKANFYILYFKAIWSAKFLLPMPVSALMMVAHVGRGLVLSHVESISHLRPFTSSFPHLMFFNSASGIPS